MTIRFLSTLYTGRNGGGRVCKAIEHNESSSYPQLLASSCRPPQISSEITRQSRLPVGEALPGCSVPAAHHYLICHSAKRPPLAPPFGLVDSSFLEKQVMMFSDAKNHKT